MCLIIASRKSDLARLQAYMVGGAIKDKRPNIEIEYHFKSSLGDKNQDDPLWKMPSQGVFTEDFRSDLIAGKVDMVVHSWKDLPTEMSNDTILAATLPRADHRDLLLVKKSAIPNIKKVKSLKLLSSSPRRMFNLEDFLKQAFPYGLNAVEFSDVRGNIQTRLNKMLEGKADGLIVAKAAIDRLLTAGNFNQKNDSFDKSVKAIRTIVEQCEFMVLPASSNPPAAAQGALVVEIANGREGLADILSEINCKQTFEDVKVERKILASYGGGCHQKIGVWVNELEEGLVISLKGETDAGEKLNQFSLLVKKLMAKDVAQAEIFRSSKYNKLFAREPISISAESLEKIAKTDVLHLASPNIPDQYIDAIDDQIIWASGITSWFKFAAKGIWVNGVDDNLGSSANRQLEILLNNSNPNWLTLTHESSPSTPAIATYKLVPNSTSLNYNGEQYFYWRSASAFRRAIELEPEIKYGIHACGVGQSLAIIKEIVGDDGMVTPFISEEDWLGQIS